jgi:IS5 family transposase
MNLKPYHQMKEDADKEGTLMIQLTYTDALSPEWVAANITNPIHELVILRKVIPWGNIRKRLQRYYHGAKGPMGKPIRMMVALLIVMKLRGLSDRGVVAQVKENRYLQYFCNVPVEGLQTFLHPTSLVKFRQRLGEEGIAFIEQEVFDRLRRTGVIQGDAALIDSSVLPNNIVYPNDVQLLVNAFKKMKQCAKRHHLPIWWDEGEIKTLWRAFGLAKGAERAAWLRTVFLLFSPALDTFRTLVPSLHTTPKRQHKAEKLLRLLTLLEEQTRDKLTGNRHIANRLVSLDEPDARPIKKGKVHPPCEFGTTLQFTFNRAGFLITVDNFIGSPDDTTLFPGTLARYCHRMKAPPATIVTDLGFRSAANFAAAEASQTIFLGRTQDVPEDQQGFCCSARSATEGLIAVAKHLRGFGRSLYRGFTGDRIWSFLCQTAYNLKKFLQLYEAEKLDEECLFKLDVA